MAQGKGGSEAPGAGGMKIGYAGKGLTPLAGGSGRPCDLETYASYSDDRPVVVFMVRTYDKESGKELDQQGIGLSIDEARELHSAFGEAIRAAQDSRQAQTSSTIDDLTWDIMSLLYAEHRDGALKVQWDRLGDLPGSDVPAGTSISLLRTLYELEGAELLRMIDVEVIPGSKGTYRYARATSDPGVAITDAGIQWVERFAAEEEGRSIGF